MIITCVYIVIFKNSFSVTDDSINNETFLVSLLIHCNKWTCSSNGRELYCNNILNVEGGLREWSKLHCFKTNNVNPRLVWIKDAAHSWRTVTKTQTSPYMWIWSPRRSHVKYPDTLINVKKTNKRNQTKCGNKTKLIWFTNFISYNNSRMWTLGDTIPPQELTGEPVKQTPRCVCCACYYI